jgi:Protochlamydia outer membrane protein
MAVVLTAFFVSKAAASDGGFLEMREKSLELNVGYRRDYLKWQFEDPSIKVLQALLPVAADRFAPLENVIPNFLPSDLSNLGVGVAEAILSNNSVYSNDWSNMHMINIGGIAKAITCNNLYFRFGGNWAYAADGQSRTNGLFAGDNECLTNLAAGCFCPYKRVHGNTWDLFGAMGFQICMCDDDFLFTPVIGFAYNNIDVKTCNNDLFTNHRNFILNMIFEEVTNISIIGFSKSDYKGHWTGPYLGFDAIYRLNCKLNLFTGFEFHWAAYRADSRLNSMIKLGVQGDFLFDNAQSVRFIHYACARGLFWNFGANYNFCGCWIGGVKFSWMDWRIYKPGRIRSEVNSSLVGNESVNGVPVEFLTAFHKDTRLKDVHWGSYRMEVTVGYEF